MQDFVVNILIALCVIVGPISAEEVPALMRPLTTIEIRYVDDGAADASVVEHATQQVKPILERGDRAVPLLIDCLDSREPTKAVAVTHGRQGEKTTTVPLGYICLDVLMQTTNSAVADVEDCSDDGLGACIEEGFYFRPDIYSTASTSFEAEAKVAAVKKAWHAAFERDSVKFVYPSLWR